MAGVGLSIVGVVGVLHWTKACGGRSSHAVAFIGERAACLHGLERDVTVAPIVVVCGLAFGVLILAQEGACERGVAVHVGG